ncbi:50S ribosomal protein L29 [bacterium]|nr:50S ribosomal protein L29 [bacterium]
MKIMEELKGKPTADLKVLLDNTREELFKIRFASTTEPVDHPNKITEARRKIARIHTILRQRDIEAKKQAQPAAAKPAAVPDAPGSGAAPRPANKREK